MEHLNQQDLKYGVIYVFFDPVRKAFLDRGAGLFEKIVHPFEVQWIEEPGRGLDNTSLVARRFNVGNTGQYATVTLRLSPDNPRGVQFDALNEFRDKLFEVNDMDDGDIVIDEDDFVPRSFIRSHGWEAQFDVAPRSAAPQDKTRVESPTKRVAKKASRWLKDRFDYAEEAADECQMIEDPTPDLLQEEGDEIWQMERERKASLQRIRRENINYVAQYHEDPKELLQELLHGKVIVGQPGRVLVNGDMKIVLPEYDEMEIEMPAMCRTLYILFMKLRKQGDGGLVLRNIDEYREEILDIYGLVKPGANDQRVRKTVENLCNPFSDSLNQMISRTNRCVRSVILDKELAKQYIIAGNRGEEYGIALDPQYLELPRAVTGT